MGRGIFLLVLLVHWRSLEVDAVSRPARTNLKQMKAVCTNEGIRVTVEFNKAFQGVAYSLGHYDHPRCRYITNDSLNRPGDTNYTFLIPVGECGTIYQDGPVADGLQKVREPKRERQQRSKSNEAPSWDKLEADPGNEIFMENTLLIQSDPTIQEAGDLAQKLRCVWHKTIHKPLTASLPYREISSGKPVSHRGQSKYGTVMAISGVRRPQTPHRHHTHFQSHRRRQEVVNDENQGHQLQPHRHAPTGEILAEKTPFSQYHPHQTPRDEDVVLGRRKSPGIGSTTEQNSPGRRKWSRSIHQDQPQPSRQAHPMGQSKITGRSEIQKENTRETLKSNYEYQKQTSNGSPLFHFSLFPIIAFVVIYPVLM